MVIVYNIHIYIFPTLSQIKPREGELEESDILLRMMKTIHECTLYDYIVFGSLVGHYSVIIEVRALTYTFLLKVAENLS